MFRGVNQTLPYFKYFFDTYYYLKIRKLSPSELLKYIINLKIDHSAVQL